MDGSTVFVVIAVSGIVLFNVAFVLIVYGALTKGRRSRHGIGGRGGMGGGGGFGGGGGGGGL
ncbi:hypothetical protein [Streptomyces sp. NPDC127098]|uniref:hypothetical protein n=1 Tax=Streptomyces sp. NPDC127098 TaxID=3347137 RepID=UPI0036493C66